MSAEGSCCTGEELCTIGVSLFVLRCEESRLTITRASVGIGRAVALAACVPTLALHLSSSASITASCPLPTT